MSLATRRRAIYTGLAGHFAEDKLLAVLALWESKYADKPPFALNEFLGEVAAATERKLERAKLYRELVGALTGPLSALLPDPEPQLLSWRQRMGQLRQLLNLLYIGLCEYLGPVVADQCLTQAAQQVEALHLAFAPRKLL